ncbi:MAG: CHASE2 domain-containing protein [Spirochaetaceae bacterium]|nr:MAG: CHASE2 domain-containing protein [Spirochaetaceae bacterium]
MVKRFLLLGIIPVSFALLFSLLALSGMLATAEYVLYNGFLHLKPPIAEDPSILMVNIDDLAIRATNTSWPWPRDYVANGMVLLKEFNAKSIVFDIIYEQPSPPGVNLTKYSGLYDVLDSEYARLADDMIAVVSAVFQGYIRQREEVQNALDMYMEEMDSSKKTLSGEIRQLAEDRDVILGDAARYFGNSYFTALVQDKDSAAQTGTQDLTRLFPEKISVTGEWPRKTSVIVPPITPVLAGGRGFGFPNVVVDSDGVMRRIDLFYQHNDKFLPQLALVSVLGILGNPQVELSPGQVLLKGANHPTLGKQVDISIPLDENNRMLINWPAKKYNNSFRHISFWLLINHEIVLEKIVHNLSILMDMEGKGKIAHDGKYNTFLSNTYFAAKSLLQELLHGKSPRTFDDYLALRDSFFSQIEKYISTEKEASVFAGIRAENEAELKDSQNTVRSIFSVVRNEQYPLLKEIREVLKTQVPGSMCFTSWTATSTNDIGVNPFDGEYINVGTHASVANTILQQSFLDESPIWVSMVAAFVLAILIYLAVYGRKRPLFSVMAGSLGIIFIILCFLLIFITTGMYVPAVPPILAVVFTFIVFTVVNFLQTAREKTFIRNAFSHYLSKDVITELIADPSKLKLGGDEKTLTAMFTDIKGFSTFSEVLTPINLVSLLNDYLTGMSNIILEIGGTIDKYIGDAIVSFFGAPVPRANHAELACMAAVRMHKAESMLNERFLAEKKSPTPLFTRMGIHTGEMVVGNMGTANKLNYTIMGNHVNFASRLEGVNKHYGTAILVSENTILNAGQSLLARKLDRVQVIGIKKPVQIFELVDEKKDARPEVFEAVEIFHAGLDLYLNREWDKARAKFRDVQMLKPADPPSELFLKRCADFRKNPPPGNWTGVFSLTTK